MKDDNLGPRNFNVRPEKSDDFFMNDKNPYGEDERWWWIFQNPLGVIIMVAVAVVLVIGLWFVFHSSSQPATSSGNIPVIKGNLEPYKEAPSADANPGVENQDKQVYKRIGKAIDDQDADDSVAVEQEKPMDIAQVPDVSQQPVGKKNLDKPNDLRKLTETIGVKMPEPVANEQFIAEKKQSVTIDDSDTLTENAQEANKPAKKKESVKAKATKGLSSGTYTIRIASFRKLETAERELQRVFDTLGAPLQGVGRLIKRLETDSGTFYVVTIGAFPNLSKAKQISKQLKEKNFDSVIQKVHE